MKRILSTLTLLLCFAFTAVNAQVITVERAAEIANSFFSAGVQKSGAARGVVASSGLTASFDSNDVTDATSANPTFYVLTNPEGGFVIVSGEETENPIIGYSFDGTIDTGNLPDGFVDYMTDIDAQVKALREYNANNPQKAAAARSAMQRTNYNATSMGNIVKDLKVANFHQDSPFNNLCFTKDGRQAVAGCVPIAYAMLCNYYNWPIAATGTGVHAGTGETMQFGHEYDWNNILDDYSGTYNDEEATAVATLVRDLGWAYQVGYGVSDTGSGKTEGASVLIEQFGFKSLSTTHSSETYATDRDVYNNDEGWKAIIKDCLNNNYPIPYSAYNTSTKGRHIFMLDGYTDNDYYHFNWGWGDGNGWFTLDNMVPSANKTYTSVHRAYFYLMPNTTTYTVEATVNDSNMGTVSINGGTAGSTATANLFSGATATLTAHPVQGYALASWTKGGEIVGSRNTIEVTVGTDANEYVANFDAEANVLVVKDYVVNTTNGSLNNGSNKSSIWTSTDNQPTLTLKTTADNDVVVEGMSVSSGNHKFFATAYDVNATKAYTNVTYTLSVPEGYVIKDYTMTYIVRTANQISLNGELLTSTGTFELSATPNAQTASFTLSVSSAGQQYITSKSIAVTVQSEGGTGGSTPTTYTISVAAGEGGSAYIGTKGTTEKTVSHNENVTITAEANDGYRFVEWRAWNSHFSSIAQQDVTVTTDVTYTAVFEAEAQEPAQNITGTIVGVTNIPTEKVDLSQGLQTGYYLLKQVNDDANAADGQGVGWIKANSEAAGQPESSAAKEEYSSYSRKSVGTSTANPDVLCVWYVEVVNAENKEIKISTANKIGSWYLPQGSERQKGLTSYENATVLKYHIGTVTLGSKTATVKDGACFISNSDVSSFIHFSGTELGSWTDANQGSMFMVEFYKLSIDDLVQKNIVTFEGATYTKTDGTELTSGWGYQVVTQTTPAVTIKVAETINNFGYTTGVISGVKTPYLYKNTNFILSISEQYKITGYKITVRGQDNSYSGDFTCSVGGNETSKATLSGTTTQTLSATGLDTNIINISVGGTSGNGIFITALEITYVENEFEPLPFKAEIDGWRNDNPNTHLGTITIGGTPMKLTPEHRTASELLLNEGTTLAFTRKYRGFEFNGFYIGATELGQNPTLTADNVAAINETTPLVAKFTATDDVTLFYDDDEFSYRIPAIAKTGTNRLVAISDYRHSHDDIGRDNHHTGTLRVDLVMRTSDDNGLTWSAKQTIAEGTSTFGYGDAAVAANGENILVMAVAGNVFFTNANANNKQRTYRIYSSDNGATWNKEEVSNNLYTLFPNGYGMFFGSGKLVVDPNFNNSGNARVYGAVLLNDGNNYVVYSDNWGSTWNILGGGAAASANEPKVEILPNGQILLSARRNGGRTFNVFTYTDKANNAGTWSTATNGCDNGGNGTNGEIICLDAKRPNGTRTKILLQSQPNGSDRRDVSIWYKEISANETYTASSIASDWTMGKQVSTQLSAYSAMCLQENGEIALFFEEAPCYGDDHTKGYSMVYVPLTIEEITGENFLNPNAVVETVTVDVTLTDGEGNTYTHQFDYLPGDAAAINAALKAAYPFITELGENGNLEQTGEKAYTYTNTVTLPFKVSNANTTVWHNIYWPSYNPVSGSGRTGCPVYLSATEGNSNVPKVTADAYYGESDYNTLNWADRLSWAVYNVNNSFTFKFKNKLTGKYIQATSVATGNAQNVVYANENNATAFELLPDSYSYVGDYALVAKVGETTGYLCSTSATGYHYATHYNGANTNRHEGAWVKFVEAPDYQSLVDEFAANLDKFGAGEGNYVTNSTINGLKESNLNTMPLNTLTANAQTVESTMGSYREVVLTVNDDETETVPGSVSITVNGSEAETVNNKFVPANATVSILATANPGYRFVNWTRPAAQASAAARTAEARNSNVVSDQNPYTVTVSEALSLEANFEEIVVNATLTDAQGNTYNVQLSGFTTGITTGTVAAKLTEKYPYITLGTTDANGNVIDNGVLNINGTAYTYSNNVTLPFKVSSLSDATKTYLHNIYYPSNNKKHSGYPNYIAAFNDEDNIVDMAESPDDAYGYNPTYNTMNGNPMISWAVYSVNNSFEFVFKNELTNKYIKVESVSSSTTNNVKFVDNAGDATAFTLLKDAGSYNGDYALVAKVGDATGYLCATSSSTNYVTHFDKNDHQGAWVKFVEVDYGQYIGVLDTKLRKFDVGDDKHMITDEIQPMINALVDDYGANITKSQFEAYFKAIDAMDAENWPKLSLTIAPDNSGTTTIAGEEGVTRKYVPTGNLTINATPSTGYSFAGWYDGENLISAEASYTFPVTSDINYTARFNEEAGETPTTVAIHITVASTDGTTVTNAVDGNVKAVIGGIGQGWATDADFVVGADVKLVASSDYDLKAYLFDGWYKNDVLVSKELAITVEATETATYQARFFRGCVVRGESNNNRFGNITSITLADGTSIGYDAGDRAVVKPGTEVKINTYINMYGYEVGSWTNANDQVVGTDKDLIIMVNEDVTYTATFEPASYNLTVRANDDERGTVSAESGTSTGTTIKVGHNMEAAITATANDGFYFVNWTKGTDVVSESATYTISGIANVEDMADAEYIANFLPVENATPGTYYRIGYEFPPAADTYSINSNTGVLNNVKSSKYTEWIDNTIDATELSLRATNSDGTPVHAIKKAAGDYYYQFNAYTCDDSNTYSTSTKYTLSVSGNYIIKECSITYKQSVAGQVTISYGDKSDAFNNTSDNTLSLSPNAQTVEFTLTSSSKTSNYYLHIKNFTVTIQPVGGETPEPESEAVRYYVQSEACGVSGKENALIMRSKDDENYNVASSIFYYADSKLLSYDKGLYIKEDGGTRGLQAVGTSGTVTITTSGKTATIAAPSYMHAVDGTTRYVDHCGSNPDNHAANHNFVLEEVESLPVTISAAGYASWYAPVAVELPDEIEAWYFKGDIIKVGDVRYAKMTKINGNVVPAIVPANTGVILKDLNCNGNESNTYELTITTEEPDYADEVKVLNKLEGTVAAQYVNKGKAYVLSKQNGQIGFYRATTAGQQENVFLNNSHKAYLPASNLPGDALQSAGFRFSFGGTTDIEEVETESSEVNAIYDLTGRKLEGISGTGIYIVNGKKVLVK